MICIVCSKEFSAARSTAKYCSGGCKLKYNRGVVVGVGSVAKKIKIIDETWQDRYEKCDGCDGGNCASGFKPNWLQYGSKETFIKKIKLKIK